MHADAAKTVSSLAHIELIYTGLKVIVPSIRFYAVQSDSTQTKFSIINYPKSTVKYQMPSYVHNCGASLLVGFDGNRPYVQGLGT